MNTMIFSNWRFFKKKFRNPTLERQFSPGLWDIVRMVREGRMAWPKYVKNTATPQVDLPLKAQDIALTFVNHATFLIQFPGLNVLTDPVWSKRASPVSWAGPKRVRDPGIAFEELPRIDVVVISHNHYDHLDRATLMRLEKRFSPLIIVPMGDKALVESMGVTNVKELSWWETVDVNANTKITFTPTQHSSARSLFDRDRSLWGSYIIEHGKRSVYFGGDAGYSSHYKEIKRRLGSPDIALLGIGAYLPRWFMKPMHMDPFEGVVAHKELGATLSVGMHFRTFRLASEGFDQPQEDLARALKDQKISENNFIILDEGQTRVISKS